MRRRYALLMGSTAKFDPTNADISNNVMDRNLELMANSLDLLGAYGFGWPEKTVLPSRSKRSNESKGSPKSIRNPMRGTVSNIIERAAPKLRECELCLFYYFGHGTIQEGSLQLASGASKTRAGFISLTEIVSQFFDAGVPKLVIIVDCCHGGHATTTSPMAVFRDKMFFIAGSGEGYARFDNSGGLFTRALSKAIEQRYSEPLRDRAQNAVTFQTWFAAAKRIVASENPKDEIVIPAPFGNLGSEILLPSEKEIPNAFQEQVPQRSIYSRLYLLLGILKSGRFQTAQDLYRHIRSEKIAAFRFTYITGNREQIGYVSAMVIEKYLKMAANIGFSDNSNTGWNLTREGANALTNDGAFYNRELVKGIFAWLKQNHIDEKFLRETLTDLVKNFEIPDVAAIERRLAQNALPLTVDREEFAKVLRLLSYGGVIRKAPKDTFFPI